MRPLGAGVSAPKVRVLVADDEQVIATTLASILDLAGYEICALYGGVAALRLLTLFQPTLVVTDLTTPGSIGIEVSQATLFRMPRCKILLFTGHADLHDLLRTEDAVNLPFDLLAQPISASRLLSLTGSSLCSSHPPLVLPLDTQERPVH